MNGHSVQHDYPNAIPKRNLDYCVSGMTVIDLDFQRAVKALQLNLSARVTFT